MLPALDGSSARSIEALGVGPVAWPAGAEVRPGRSKEALHGAAEAYYASTRVPRSVSFALNGSPVMRGAR